MRATLQILQSSFVQAIAELRANKLRTALSLSGITIGIFCIIAVFTVVDSLKNNIQNQMSALGGDVLYVERWPWTGEEGDGGEYKWWEYLRRPGMTVSDLRAVEQRVPGLQSACLFLQLQVPVLKHDDEELQSVACYSVTRNFDFIQNINIRDGRYLSNAEIDAGSNTVVLGSQIARELFGSVSPIGKAVTMYGKRFFVAGTLASTGQNQVGFDYDNSILIPYYSALNLVNEQSLNYNPTLIVKSKPGVAVQATKEELEGVLRSVRRVVPGAKNNFSINQLSQIAAQVDTLFATVNGVGSIIAIFSLLVGGFGIANIMFVTVKERTKIIGLKKAIGAKPSVILKEFLMETITLCVIGGLIGIVIVFLMSLGLTRLLDFPVTLSLQNFLIGLSVSAGVGLVAGYIPARAASKLDPVVAIRST